MTKVTIKFTGGVTPQDVSINGTQWTQTSGKQGFVENVESGVGFLGWFVSGNPGTSFTITLTSAVKRSTGLTSWEQSISNSLLMKADVNQITIN